MQAAFVSQLTHFVFYSSHRICNLLLKIAFFFFQLKIHFECSIDFVRHGLVVGQEENRNCCVW